MSEIAEKTKPAELQERGMEIAKAKTQGFRENIPEVPDVISPLEEARKLKEELSKIKNELSVERLAIEKHRAEMDLSGRGWAGARPPTQEELDKAEADKIVNNFMPKR